MVRPFTGAGVGPYRFEGRLGSGASGVVYRAVDEAGRRAAVKVLHGHVEDPDQRERFRREAQLGLDHPNVVGILGAGFAEGDVPYIAFELLEGESFEARLTGGPLRPLEVVRLGRQALAGLAAAHARGIVHRDLKPANLFLTRDGTLKILDFGVALATSRATRLTQAEAIMGTPAYLSPEQARGLRDLDARTDIWALGAILYEAVSGKMPFARESVFATLVAIRKDELPPLAALVPGLAPGLVAVIERALIKDREGRWPTVAAMDAALAGVDLTPLTRPRVIRKAAPTTETEALGSAESRVLAMLLCHEVRDYEALRAAVEAEGGRLVALRGERALGLFGLEAWVGDEVSRAVRAGLEARAAAGPMAVSSGQATIAGDQIGGPVLEAARRGCGARLAGLVIDTESAKSLQTRLSMRFHPEGLAEITARRLPTRHIETPRTTGESEVIGRAPELTALRRGLEAAARGHASALILSGPPGIGKTRLCQEATRLARATQPSFAIYLGHGALHRQESALATVRSLLVHELRRFIGGAEAAFGELPMSERHQAVVALVQEASDEALNAAACVESLCVLLGVEVAASATLQAALRDARLMSERLRTGVLDYFEAALRRGPIALVIEELQWVDDASLDLVEELFVRRAASPIFVLATSRVPVLAHRPHLFEAGNVKRLELGGLGQADVSRLVQLATGRRMPEAALRQLSLHTAGNPLFVEQIARALGQTELAEADGDLPLPLSVRAAVQSRLDQLATAEKVVTKWAAIFDRPFFSDELTALGLPDVTAPLAMLAEQGVLAPRGRPHPKRGQQYRFQNQLVSEVAYGMLTPELRRGLHQRVAELLARAPDAPPEEAASHFELGGLPEPAARHYHSAALAAARVGDARGTLRCAAKALELGAHPEARFALHMARAEALRSEGRRDAQAEALADAFASANDDAQRARAWCDEARFLLEEGQLERARAVAEEAEQAARAAADDEVLALALGCSVVCLARTGAHAEAEQRLGEAAALASSFGPDVRAEAATWRARLALCRGDLEERQRALEDALALFEEAGDAGRAAGIAVELADLHGRFGRYEVAADELQVAIDGCRQAGNRVGEAYAWAHLAFALGMTHHQSEAHNALEESLQLARALGDTRLELLCQVRRLQISADTSPPEEVITLAEAAREEARQRGEPGLEALSLALSARARLRAGDARGALKRAEQAMALRDARGGLEEDETLLHVALAEALGESP